MKCPRQTAFIIHLDELLAIYWESMRDRFSVDQQDKFIDEFSEKKKFFINLWGPMPKRVLTLVVELDENEKPNWIWESHKDHEYIHGVKVKMICEGAQISYFEDEDED